MRKSIAAWLRRLADDIDCPLPAPLPPQERITLRSTARTLAECEALQDEVVKQLRSKNPPVRKSKTRKA
jgi:hypothetical protein